LMQGVDIDNLIGMDCNVLVQHAKTKSGQTYNNVDRVFK
jgi:hypothetical protein